MQKKAQNPFANYNISFPVIVLPVSKNANFVMVSHRFNWNSGPNSNGFFQAKLLLFAFFTWWKRCWYGFNGDLTCNLLKRMWYLWYTMLMELKLFTLQEVPWYIWTQTNCANPEKFATHICYICTTTWFSPIILRGSEITCKSEACLATVPAPKIDLKYVHFTEFFAVLFKRNRQNLAKCANVQS